MIVVDAFGEFGSDGFKLNQFGVLDLINNHGILDLNEYKNWAS